MNLIRNGGFERGDTEFWEITTSETFTIETGEKRYGTYSGKVVSSAAAMQGIRSKDFIEVNEGDLINAFCWLKTSLVVPTRFRVYEYDENLVLMENQAIGRSAGGSGWLRNYGQYLVNPGVSYVKIGVVSIFTANDQIMYVDAVVINKLDMKDCFRLVRELANIQNATASGDSVDDAVEMCSGIQYYAELSVTSFTGTSPTMDVEIREYDEVGYVRVLGTFTQVTAATNQRVGIQRPVGTRLHASWTMGGTVTDADFKVNVIGVR